MSIPEMPKSINLAIGGLEEVTLAFGPHPAGTLNFYQPFDVPTAELKVLHSVLPLSDRLGGPVIETVQITPLKFVDEGTEFKLLHKFGAEEEIITVTVKTLLLATKA